MSFLEAGKAIVEKIDAPLYKVGTEIMADSQELVPVQYGTLKRSGVVEQPVHEGDRVYVVVGYGYGSETGPDGETADQYAVYVHEIERYHHAPPTTYKFLEKPARAKEADFGSIIADGIRLTGV